jgi:hypothetical protein
MPRLDLQIFTATMLSSGCGPGDDLLSSRTMGPTGYLSEKYVQSMGEFGRPVRLPRSGGFLLERPIPGTADRDALGPYPLFCCTDWPSLSADLADLQGRLVSVVVVTDPFGPEAPAELAEAFSHGLIRYKDHVVVDLEMPLERSVSPHHRRNARRALSRLTVEGIVEPRRSLDTWCQLYSELIHRHGITGMSRFSRRAFEAQLSAPGLVAFRAIDDRADTVGMVLWYLQGAVGYYHLAAYSPRGYEEKASYALFWTSADRLRHRLRWLSLGAGAGVKCDGMDGLTRFKKGWSSLVRPTYLGRHVASPDRYVALCSGHEHADFFPAYRSPVTAVA